jgi:hypothetical protein
MLSSWNTEGSRTGLSLIFVDLPNGLEKGERIPSSNSIAARAANL